METKFSKALTLTITNFSKKIKPLTSPPFLSGGCEWIVEVYPKGNNCDNYLSLFLSVKEPNSLNWTRRANFYFVLLNQSGQGTSRTPESGDMWFYADSFIFGFQKAFPLKKVFKKEVLVNDRLIIEVHVKVIEVVDGHHKVQASLFTNKLLSNEKEETVDVNGFNVLSSQVTSVKQIFVEHPNIAIGFRLKNEVVKTEYMNVLLRLVETVKKPLKSISDSELSKAHMELCELREVGFKLEWLKTKLEECKKADTEGFRIQQLEEYLKIYEEHFKINEERLKKLEEYVKKREEYIKKLEKVKKPNTEGFRIQQRKEYVKKLEEDVKKFEEHIKVVEEVKKANTGGFRIQQFEEYVKKLEEQVKILEVHIKKLKEHIKKLEEIKKANTEGFRIQQLDEHVKKLELTVSGLQVELDKEKTKSEEKLSNLKTELANEKVKSETASVKFWVLKATFSDLKVELDKEKAKSAKVLSDLEVKQDQNKGNSASTDNLLSWEDDDLFKPTNCLGIQKRKYGYKRIN